MQKSIEYIEKNLTKKKLEEISAFVIDAYKRGDSFMLNTYAASLNGNTGKSEPAKKVFYSLIRQLHPDRLPVLLEDFRSAVAMNDSVRIEHLRTLLQLKKEAEKKKTERFEYSYYEEWTEDFDSYENMEDWDSQSDVYENESYTDGSFLSALQSELFGNHDIEIEPSDLSQIDGSLTISFCSISDLSGIEYCRNLRSLDISGNELDTIYDLRELVQLEELYACDNRISDMEPLSLLESLEILDLSGNDIDDISPALKLPNLKFLDIRNNPVSDYTVIALLEAEGIVVLR